MTPIARPKAAAPKDFEGQRAEAEPAPNWLVARRPVEALAGLAPTSTGRIEALLPE